MIQYAALLAFAAFALLYFNRRRSFHLPLPPGPKKLPLFGNLFGLPTKFEWETFTKWSKELGKCIVAILFGLCTYLTVAPTAVGSDIIHLSVVGKSIIILSSVDGVFDLLDRRSANYSDRRVANRVYLKPINHDFRPRSIMVNELMGFEFAFGESAFKFGA
jgi:hypothetical protein